MVATQRGDIFIVGEDESVNEQSRRYGGEIKPTGLHSVVSRDNGITWSNPLRIENQARAFNYYDNYQVQLCVGSGNRIHLVYLHWGYPDSSSSKYRYQMENFAQIAEYILAKHGRSPDG